MFIGRISILQLVLVWTCFWVIGYFGKFNIRILGSSALPKDARKMA
jgi:hypothetical protein